MCRAAWSASGPRTGRPATATTCSSLHRRGHEIGCHTFSHLRACDLDEAALAGEIARNRDYFRALDPSIEIDTFAYPFGYGSFARKRQLKDQFQTCRSIVPGVNAGSVDPQFLRAMPLIDRQIDRDGIERAFDEAQTDNGWLIFYGHDVADRPSPYGCSPALLNHALEAAVAPENPGFDHGGGNAMRLRLNALFAISVNSPSMSMVNFPCCVVPAL